jgi:hypothetical protein
VLHKHQSLAEARLVFYAPAKNHSRSATLGDFFWGIKKAFSFEKALMLVIPKGTHFIDVNNLTKSKTDTIFNCLSCI